MKRRKLSFLGLVVAAAILIGVVILRTPGTEKEGTTSHILPEVEEQVEPLALKEPVEHEDVAHKVGETDEVSVREEATEEEQVEIERLIKRLNSPSWVERSDAAQKLGYMREKATAAVPYLVDMLDDEPGMVRRVYLRTRMRLTDERWMLNELHSPPADRAAFALGMIGEAAVEPLLAALEDPAPTIRARAAKGLGLTKDRRAVEPLLAALEDGDLEVWANAAQALGQIGDPRAVDPLIGMLQQENRGVRIFAARALGEIGDERAVGPLIVALEDEDPFVQFGAAQALGEIGDSRAVEPLMAALERKQEEGQRDGEPLPDSMTAQVIPMAQEQMLYALGEIGDDRAVDLLAAFLDDENARLRRAAAVGLGEIGDDRALEPLIATLQDGDPSVRKGAARALGEMRNVRAVEPLVAALGDVDEGVRSSAGWTLVRALQILAGWPETDSPDNQLKEVQRGIGVVDVLVGSEVVDALLGRLEDPDADVRSDAAQALGLIGDHRAIEPLIDAMEKYAAESGSSYPSVDQLLDDEDFQAAISAAVALTMMTGEDFGRDPAKWRAWWEENRDTFLEKGAEAEATDAAGTREQ